MSLLIIEKLHVGKVLEKTVLDQSAGFLRIWVKIVVRREILKIHRELETRFYKLNICVIWSSDISHNCAPSQHKAHFQISS